VSEKPLFAKSLMRTVPGIPRSQADRTLGNSQAAWDKLNHDGFNLASLRNDMEGTAARASELVLVSAWLSHKLQGHHKALTEVSGAAVSTGLDDPWVTTSTGMSPRSWGYESGSGLSEACGIQIVAEEVKDLIEKCTTDISQEVATSLKEKMTELQERQSSQEGRMDPQRNELEGIRNLIYTLIHTCDRISQLIPHMQEGSEPPDQMLTLSATAVPPHARLTQRRPRRTPSHDNAYNQ